MLSIERMVMSERALGGAESNGAETSARERILLLFVPWVLQGNLAPPRAGRGAASCPADHAPKLQRRGVGGRARAGGGWGRGKFVLIGWIFG